MIRRREFLIASASAAVAGGIRAQQPGRATLDRIAIMSLCFSPVIKSAAHPDDPKRTLEIMDLPGMIAERYGVHHVEMQHSHFASTESGYLEQFRNRLQKAKSSMNQINVEFGPHNISAPDPVVRQETIDMTNKWVDYAVLLGCPRVMVNQGTLAPDVRQAAIETLRTINAYAKPKQVFITMENRGVGRAPTWQVVVEVIKASGIYANPDIGNFADEESRAAGLRALYPLSSGSSHCHYDPGRYSEANAIRISKEVGYKGLYSIEAAANNGPDPYVAVQTILDELLKDI
ncbi:MAG TPA: TIM barrel protein [Verrucomicrobiae bacterium]|nr:TIM barrel protein [Verrucomicrobiae bacterium]